LGQTTQSFVYILEDMVQTVTQEGGQYVMGSKFEGAKL